MQKDPQISEWCRVVLPDRNLMEALRSIGEQRKTGSLTVHFGQGGVTMLEWQQKSIVRNVWPFAVAQRVASSK